MTKEQFKKKFGTEGTRKSRKQAQVAIARGKTPSQSSRFPFYDPDKKRLTKPEKILDRIQKKLNRTI